VSWISAYDKPPHMLFSKHLCQSSLNRGSCHFGVIPVIPFFKELGHIRETGGTARNALKFSQLSHNWRITLKMHVTARVEWNLRNRIPPSPVFA
jgi:hypothetical protein